MGGEIKLVSLKSHILRLKYTRAYKVKDVALMIQRHWLCSEIRVSVIPFKLNNKTFPIREESCHMALRFYSVN